MQAKFQVLDVYNITGIGVVPVGNVIEGTLKLNMTSQVKGKVMSVKSIEMHHQQLTSANVGDSIGVSLRNGDSKLLARGMVLTFSDTGVNHQNITSQQDIKPERPLGFLKRLFGK